MTALYPLPSTGELSGYYRDAALAADQRGDTEAARANREAHRDLLAHVGAPVILPRDMDETLAERMFAARTCRWVDYETDHPARFGAILSRYVKRLSAHAERRARA